MSKIKIDKEKCKGCGLCIFYCPKEQIEISKELNEKGLQFAVFKDEGECTGCCICARMCPDAAIEVYRENTDHREQNTERGKDEK